jgi:hypothetical protein
MIDLDAIHDPHAPMPDEYRKVLADIILAAVLLPWDHRYEIVARAQLDKARMLLEDGDVEAAADRAGARE